MDGFVLPEMKKKIHFLVFSGIVNGSIGDNSMMEEKTV